MQCKNLAYCRLGKGHSQTDSTAIGSYMMKTKDHGKITHPAML